MTNKQRAISKISLSPRASIRQAMEVMTRVPKRDAAAPAGIVLVTDAKRTLLGIATDGDLRRAIERGAALETPIASAMNANPFLIVGVRPNVEILEIVLEKIRTERWRRDRIRHVIMVDAGRRVLDVLSFFDLWRNSEIRFKHVGVIGLGYVGLTLALTLADHGFQVRGFDRDPRVRRGLKRGRPHFYEAGLGELLGDHLGRNFEVVDQLKPEDVCDMYIVAVGTPLDRRHQPRFVHLEQVSRTIGSVLKQGDAVILRSTVPVGTTRDVVIPILEKTSGLTAGRDFYVAFAPERTVEGKALEELKHLPQVIGGIDRASSEVAMHIFNTFTSHSVIVESLEEAEMVKLVNNAYRDVTFAFANELALICHRWGIDTGRVIAAANRDYARNQIPVPSPGVGGYCLKKDPFIYIASAHTRGYHHSLTSRARRISDEMIAFLGERIIEFLRRHHRVPKEAKVCFLGIAFKGEPVTSDVRGSTTIDLAHALKSRVGRIVGFDPAVDPADLRQSPLRYQRDAGEAMRGADVVVVMTANPAFKTLNIRRLLRSANQPSLLIDGWRLYPPEEIAKIKGVEYFPL